VLGVRNDPPLPSLPFLKHRNGKKIKNKVLNRPISNSLILYFPFFSFHSSFQFPFPLYPKENVSFFYGW